MLTFLAAVGPDFGAVGGSSGLRRIVGALMTYGLIIAVLMLVVCSIGWALSSASGNWQGATKARHGVIASLLGAMLTGGALAWANWLVGVGQTL